MSASAATPRATQPKKSTTGWERAPSCSIPLYTPMKNHADRLTTSTVSAVDTRLDLLDGVTPRVVQMPTPAAASQAHRDLRGHRGRKGDRRTASAAPCVPV